MGRMIKQKVKVAGRLTTNGVLLELHEYATINVLLADGHDVELIQKSRTPHSKSADILMEGSIWEMKSPTGRTLRAIERILYRATHQARNVVIDLRRTKLADEQLIIFLKKKFEDLRSLRILWIVLKDSTIIKMRK